MCNALSQNLLQLTRNHGTKHIGRQIQLYMCITHNVSVVGREHEAAPADSEQNELPNAFFTGIRPTTGEEQGRLAYLAMRVLSMMREKADLPLLPGPHTATMGGGQVQESYATASAASSHSRSLCAASSSTPAAAALQPPPVSINLTLWPLPLTHATLAGDLRSA